MDEMVDRLLDILADKLTERLSAGHKELYTAKELAERYGVSCATIRSKMAAGEFGELVSVGERTRLVPCFAGLGQSEAAQECERLDYYSARFEAFLHQAQQKAASGQGLPCRLGLAAGAVAALILL